MKSHRGAAEERRSGAPGVGGGGGFAGVGCAVALAEAHVRVTLVDRLIDWGDEAEEGPVVGDVDETGTT